MTELDIAILSLYNDVNSLKEGFVMNMAVRNLALDLLDDEHGVSGKAWKNMIDWLDDEGCSDIIDAVDACEGRFYLTEENAAMLREAQPNE